MKPLGTGVRTTLIVLLGLVVLSALAAWFLHTYERVEKQIALPPRGEAGYNPLYALKKTLQADGIAVDSRQRLELADPRLGTRDTLLMLDDPRTLTPDQSRRLLQWVDGGGHLLLRTPVPRKRDQGLAVPMLEALGLRLSDEAPQCQPLQVEGEASHVEFCRGRRFLFNDAEPELAWGDLRSAYVYARLAHGAGRIDVLADFDFLTNGEQAEANARPASGRGVGGLRDGPHRALARQLLAPNYGEGTMHLVYAAQMPSLLRSVLSRGWPVWAPLLLALLAWLWLRMQRFGPLRPAPAAERRSLLEHVRASGDHLFRYNRRALLYAAVRQSFLARLRGRDPVAAALNGEPQASAIARDLQVPIDLVRTALQAPASHDNAAFRDRISTLIQLRNRL